MSQASILAWAGPDTLLMLAATAAVLVLGRFLLAWSRDTRWTLLPAASGEARTLLVMVHGMNGLAKFDGAIAFAASVLPDADRLVIDYKEGFATNLDPYTVADAIEEAIHTQAKQHRYERIVLFGYSAGAALLRKAFVWAHGEEDDRERFGRRGKRAWVDQVAQFVLLAGMNRGWSVEPRFRGFGMVIYVGSVVFQGLMRVARLGRMSMSMRRGTPFISDTRVQWIRIARSDRVLDGSQPFPKVIQLIGSEDDYVSREDGQDLLASRGTVFKTLLQTDHADIASLMDGSASEGARDRQLRVAQALLGELDALEPDKVTLPEEQRDVTRLIFIVHGIRDHAEWTDVLREAIENRCRATGEKVVVINTKYGYFPMLPFILYRDRQRNVRLFMDQYTEQLARYPKAATVDFAGHSNGTYMLASALQHYATLRVRNVFFAGSVVPKHYPWMPLLDGGRVEWIANVVATKDRVVAFFPTFFEWLAWRFGARPTTGYFDLGSAGFRGFLASAESAAVNDLKFATGAHSTGRDITDPRKLQAMVGYLAAGDRAALSAFELEGSQDWLTDKLSNVSWLVWAVLVGVIGGIGVAVLLYGAAWGLFFYVLLVYALVHSV